MVNWKSKKLNDLLILGNGLVILVLLNIAASFYFFRIDLTEEKRYSIKSQTKEILRNLEDQVFVEVYLAGELNPGFTRFSRAIRETLESFRVYSDNKVTYVFTDPAKASGEKARGEFMSDLAMKGIQPTNVIDHVNGQRVERLIFPGALVSYGGDERAAMLLKGNKARTPEEEINQSIEGIEFELARIIQQLAEPDPRRVGVLKGHGELDSLEAAGLYDALSEAYEVADVRASKTDLASVDVVVVAKPRNAFSDIEKFALDQYVMNGGKLLLLLDRLDATMDSVTTPGYLAFPVDLQLDDLLFRYGLRINPDLVQDDRAAVYPVVTGQSGARPRMQLIEWPFFPLVYAFADHPITRNLDAVVVRFGSTIDTVKATGIRKTPLLFSSASSRALTAPVAVDINQFRDGAPIPEAVPLPMGFLLEGEFTSLFKNRFLPDGTDTSGFVADGKSAKIVVIADGDVARSEKNPRTGQPQPLGFDPYTNYTYANKDLVMNALSFLIDDKGLIVTRNREVRIRPLDRRQAMEEKTKWQAINVLVPVVAVVLYGIIRHWYRRRKYSIHGDGKSE
jgi:gliding-associated putative ABC transporter substrate-binding component GldG